MHRSRSVLDSLGLSPMGQQSRRHSPTFLGVPKGTRLTGGTAGTGAVAHGILVSVTGCLDSPSAPASRCSIYPHKYAPSSSSAAQSSLVLALSGEMQRPRLPT